LTYFPHSPNQIWRRTIAKASENVGSFFTYQAEVRTGKGGSFGSQGVDSIYGSQANNA
jgi:hypothetical protein